METKADYRADYREQRGTADYREHATATAEEPTMRLCQRAYAVLLAIDALEIALDGPGPERPREYTPIDGAAEDVIQHTGQMLRTAAGRLNEIEARLGRLVQSL